MVSAGLPSGGALASPGVAQVGFTEESAAPEPPARENIFQTIGHRFLEAEDPEIEIAATQASQVSFSSMQSGSSSKKWYDKLSIRGYSQFRLNETVLLRPGSAPAQYTNDRSVGDNQEFFLRRARLTISGDVSEWAYVYLQPEFASTVTGSPDNTHYTQIRDWYADLYLTSDKVHRVRVGQSKVPYGWENLQSSSNRLPLERTDALNSAVRNERDLGVFYFWTPRFAQEFFKDVLDQGLKGSGNYGMFAIGAYNGQGGSLLEQNDRLHIATRFTLPFQLPNCQYVELGMQGYTGDYVVTGSTISPLGVGTLTPANSLGGTPNGRPGIRDQRLAWTAVWYPQPFGFQAEWNVGRGPALNAAQTAIEERSLYGGYAMWMVKYDTDYWGTHIPFFRYAYYKGGYKAERNAPFSRVTEYELGWEWQINSAVEFTSVYTMTDRTNTTANATAGTMSYNQFMGDLFRFQLQFNY